MKILYSFYNEPTGKNPYTSDLLTELRSSFSVDPLFLSVKSVLFRRIDLLHIHWPEYLVTGSTPIKAHLKRSLTVLLLARIKAEGIPVVMTVHNLVPHEEISKTGSFLLKRINELVDYRIFLNESVENDMSKGCVILHTKYKVLHQNQETSNSKQRILAFGALRPLKGFESLIDSFRRLDNNEVTLKVAGGQLVPGYGERLRNEADGDDRITIDQRFLPESELQREIAESDLIVFPYRRLYNSGAVLMALSVGVPVLVTLSPSSASLQNEVGSQWVHTFEGELTPEILSETLKEAAGFKLSTTEGPNLERRSLGSVARLHAILYSRLTSRSAGNRACFRRRPCAPEWNEEDVRLLRDHSKANRVVRVAI